MLAISSNFRLSYWHDIPSFPKLYLLQRHSPTRCNKNHHQNEYIIVLIHYATPTVRPDHVSLTIIPTISSLSKWCRPESHFTYSCLFSLEQFLHLSLTFNALLTLKCTASYFENILKTWVFITSLWLEMVIHFGRNILLIEVITYSSSFWHPLGSVSIGPADLICLLWSFDCTGPYVLLPL